MIGSQPCSIVWLLWEEHTYTHMSSSPAWKSMRCKKQHSALSDCLFWLYFLCSFPSSFSFLLFSLFIYIPRCLSVALSSVSPWSPPPLLSNCIRLVLLLSAWPSNMRAFPAGQKWQVYFPLTACHLSWVSTNVPVFTLCLSETENNMGTQRDGEWLQALAASHKVSWLND